MNTPNATISQSQQSRSVAGPYLEALQSKMSFTLHKVDVSLHPQMLASKNVKPVPVVEVGGNRQVGNVTSEQLAGLIGLREPSLAAS